MTHSTSTPVKALSTGRRNYLGSGYRAIPIAIAVEGANIMTRNLMIYGQGSIRCHPFILDEMAAAQMEDKLEGLKAFDETLFQHVAFQAKTFARAFGRSWTFLALCRFAGARTHGKVLPPRQPDQCRPRPYQRGRHGDPRRQPETHGNAVRPTG